MAGLKAWVMKFLPKRLSDREPFTCEGAFVPKYSLIRPPLPCAFCDVRGPKKLKIMTEKNLLKMIRPLSTLSKLMLACVMALMLMWSGALLAQDSSTATSAETTSAQSADQPDL